MEFKNSWWHGNLIVNRFPKDLVALFLEMEKLVENQILSLVDEVSDNIELFDLEITKPNSKHGWKIKEIQIYGLDSPVPTVCFRLLD
ncbi:hypothetical protein [Acanthopleuribacter pedis]|uniref:Uncharacterized protein n=1 Tax=Acanthopleuribacter pedis TaxID=442870 RepID=A0A8J7Q4L7_9BACT|nr:hypothetical protein [Acanthopleuribacter pedis]MBO1317982.1 hypothetical protein [Acanthopleuribacter pedis]